MALKTYADWEDAVRVARVDYDHSQAKLVHRTKTVRRSRRMAFLSVLSTAKPYSTSEPDTNKKKLFPPRKPKITDKDSKPRFTACDERPKTQIFISTPLASTICLQLPPSTSISAVKGVLQDRLGIKPEKQHLFTRKNFELCDALSLEDHCIEHDTNIELRLVAGLMGAGKKKKSKSGNKEKADVKSQPQGNSAVKQEPTAEETRQSTTEPQATAASGTKEKDDVMPPLQGNSTVNPEPTAEEMKENSPEPQATSATTEHVGGKLPARMLDWTADDVKLWLHSIGVTDSIVDKIYNGCIDGRVLHIYTEEALIKYYRMKERDIHLIICHRDLWLESEKQPCQTETTEVKPVVQGAGVRNRNTSQETAQKIYKNPKGEDAPAAEKDPGELQASVANTSSGKYVHVGEVRAENVHSCPIIGYVEKSSFNYSQVTHIHLHLHPTKAGKKDDDYLNLLYNVLRGWAQTCTHRTLEALRNIFRACGLELVRVELGSVRLVLLVKSRAGLDKLWAMFSTGELAKKLTEVLITDELTTEDKSDLAIQVTMQESDYEQACRFFENLQKEHMEGKLPAHMSHWTGEDVKRWLLSIGVTDPVVDEMYTGCIDGRVLQKYTKTGLNEDFSKMTIRDMRLILDHRDDWLQAEKQQFLTSTTQVEPVVQDVMEAGSQYQDHFRTLSAGTDKEPPVAHSAETLPPSVRPKVPKTGNKPTLERSTESLERENTAQRELQLSPPSSVENESDQARLRPPLPPTNEDECSPDKSQKRVKETPMSHQDNEARLRLLLTGDKRGEFDQSCYPVLVANKPPEPEPVQFGTDTIAQQFGFIKTIKWAAVLDFNSKSLSGGLCKLYSEDRIVNLQQPESFRDIQHEEEFRNKIDFPEKTSWVFANGYEDDSNALSPPMNLRDWTRERSKDVEASVTFFSKPSVIPKGREMIIFLLLSEDDIGILCDTFRELSSSFEGLQNITCIAEDQGIYSKFVSYAERWFKKDEIDERSLVGLEWRDVNRIIMRMNGVNQIGDNELPFSLSEKSCMVPKKQADEWNDITVVYKNECENTDMDESSPSYSQFVKRMELDFYRGEKVDWWNFAITDREAELSTGCGHVLKRKGFEETRAQVAKPLRSSESKDSMIVTVTLLHQPGAGGSTLARNVLWELHKDYRCIVVDRVTSNTVNQIAEVRRYGYEEEDASKIPPVCVLMDNLDDVEELGLITELEEVSRSVSLEGGGIQFVLLRCKRSMEPSKVVGGADDELTIPLTQQLDPEEKEWFELKARELEGKQKEYKTDDYNPNNLLAFMVMRKEFNKDYIRDVVSEILRNVNARELKLLKLCAFLNSYMHEATIPVSCCDSIMNEMVTSGAKYQTQKRPPWEKIASGAFKMILACGVRRNLNAIKILHKSIAEEALRQICQVNGDQSLFEVALEFFNSELLTSRSHSRKDLANTVHRLLISRKIWEHGEATKRDFSALIEDIGKAFGHKKAIEILDIGFEKLNDPFVAQQLARLHLKEKDFDKARASVDEALKIRPKNAYFLDTKGRIFITQLNTLWTSYLFENQVLGGDDLKKVISLSFRAMDTFRKSYEVSKESTQTLTEFTGLYTELSVAFRLLEVIDSCVEPFRTQGDINILRRYLLNLDMPPGVRYPDWENDYHHRIGQLQNRIDFVLRIMEDTTTYYRDGLSANVVGQKLHEMRETMKVFRSRYEDYYGEPEPLDETRYSKQDFVALAEHRRRKVRQLQCGSFREIFDLAVGKKLVNLEESHHLLLENQREGGHNFFDLKSLVCIHLALSSIEKELMSAHDVYQEFVRPFLKNCDRTESCWPPFFMMMFLWPIQDEELSDRGDRYKLAAHIQELKTRWEQRQNLTSQRSPQDRIKCRIRSVIKPRTHFFLGKGKGLRVFAHITELGVTQDELDTEDDNVWQAKLVKGRLARLEGDFANGAISYSFRKKNIIIELAAPQLRRTKSKETVTFYLGFSWRGPLAYNVTPKGKESCVSSAPRFHQAYLGHALPSDIVKVSSSLSKFDKILKERQKLQKKMQHLEQTKEKEKMGSFAPLQLELQNMKEELRRALEEESFDGM